MVSTWNFAEICNTVPVSSVDFRPPRTAKISNACRPCPLRCALVPRKPKSTILLGKVRIRPGIVTQRNEGRAFALSADGGSSSAEKELSVAPLHKEIVIFTTSSCKYCKQAKRALVSSGMEYFEVDVSNNLLLLEKLRIITGRFTVPQVFAGGTCVGGADDLEALIAAGGLEQCLADAPSTLPAELVKAMSENPGASADAPPKAASVGGNSQAYLDLCALADRMHSDSAGLEVADRRGVRRGLPWAMERRCFSGKSATTWLMNNAPGVVASDRQAAAELGRALQEARLIAHVTSSAAFCDDEEVYFRLQADDPAAALNMKRVWRGPVRPANEVAESLRRRIEGLYDSFLGSNGRAVDYEALAASDEFKEFVIATGELQRVDLFDMSRDDLVAFFVNVYNMLVIHGTCARGSPKNTAERLKFFGGISYHIGGHDYSADDVEHGVLRSNATTPANPIALAGYPQYASATFSQQDPRRFHVVTPMDPRIHCALVCGAKSCPPIRVYSANTLELGLKAAAEAFCEETEIDADQKTVKLSKIFFWYAKDFGPTTSEVLKWIVQYLSPEKASALNEMIALESEGDDETNEISVVYLDYDWSVNSK
mmetsp:Transcript_21685/g.41419  ORF Transcript_21685/g.41419 Transcript_21685/m.41419 type:complete len:599 (+) Transcript_21685:1-1797(+)